MVNKAYLLGLILYAQTSYKSDSLVIRFYSDAPLEKIEALNKGSSIYVTQDSVFCRVPIKLFRFANQLMEEHFNENYMESDKYPYAYFRGRIRPFSTDSVLAVGDLEIHNVTQKRTLPMYLNQDKQFYAHFKVRLEEHRIRIPKLVIKKITEEVDVYVKGHLIPTN